MFTFNLRFFLFAVGLFIVEVLIALYMHDPFIRPYFGDFLVVILMYCGLRAFFTTAPLKIAIAVLLFSYLIELSQYFNLVDRLGFANNKVVRTVLGYGFEYRDFLAYTLGIITVLLLEMYCGRGLRQPQP